VSLSSILAQLKSHLLPACPVRARLQKKIALLATLAPMMASLAFLPLPESRALPDSSDYRVRELALPLDDHGTTDQSLPVAITTPSPAWHMVDVGRNDTLGSIFQRAGLKERDAYLLTASSKRARQIATQLRPGQQVHFLLNTQQELQQLRVVEDKLHYTEFSRADNGSYQLQEVTLTPDVLYGFAEARIDNSLFESANQAGVEDRLTMKLADVFGWDIDFAMDIRSGDSFHMVYEQLYLNGEKIGNGDIVAAEFRNRGQVYQAIRYTDSSGDTAYYTPEGGSMRKEFLRSPIEFARISSHFNLKRKHPILHTIRAHKGTDYAAARGTPIRATGDGRIRFAGNKGGYGKVVIIQHGQSYETVYGHLQGYARGVRSGFKVKQGQVIGYVGSSGLATGPHLHYEFHVNGIERNPVTVKFPFTASISATEKPRFLAESSRYMLQLASYLGRPFPTQLALAE
jgi:murein DD-endopeptidase MepM/ murein hydrolase activator NlpD